MPTRPRTPSRGRPARRAQSASRKTKSPAKKSSPQKSTPKSKSRSTSRSRKVATAPAAVSGKRRESPRRVSPHPNAAIKKGAASISSKGTQHPTSSITVSTSSISPPILRSRALGVALAQPPQSQKLTALARNGPKRSWRDAIKDNILTRQFGKMAKSIKRGPRPMLKDTAKHLKNNAKYYILAFVVLILAGIIYKFQRELLTNVQQINKQVMEFVQQQYKQQRQIFGEYLHKTQQAMEQARQKYLSESPPSQPPLDQQQSPTSTPSPPPKPTRTPHLTDTI